MTIPDATLDQWEADAGKSQPACARCQVLALIGELRRLRKIETAATDLATTLAEYRPTEGSD